MSPDAASVNTWRKILSGLIVATNREKVGSQGVLDEVPAHKKGRRRECFSGISLGRVDCNDVGCASILILDRTEKKATIGWHDPTSCYYADQCWTRSVASRVGVCAVSGEIIARGADIFRPSRAKPVPANASAMILTSALPALAQQDYEDLNGDKDGSSQRCSFVIK